MSCQTSLTDDPGALWYVELRFTPPTITRALSAISILRWSRSFREKRQPALRGLGGLNCTTFTPAAFRRARKSADVPMEPMPS